MLKDSDLIQIDDMNQFESNDLETLLHKILNYLKHITSSEAGTIYLKEDDYLRFHIFQNDSFTYETIFNLQEPLKKFKFKIQPNTSTIAVESFLTKKILTIDDIYSETEFDFKSSREFDEKFNYKTKSILTAPLINFYSGDAIGVLQLINKKDGNNSIGFTKEDRDFISLSSYLVTLSIMTTKHSQEELAKISKEIENRIISRTKGLEEIQNHLLEQINRDSMTGLFNRRYFNEIGSNLLSIAKQTNTDMSIIMLDIDNFKLINDTYGHSVGDIVICDIAKILKLSTRNSDICVRFGGEEFIIVLPNTSLQNSVKIAEKMRRNIEINEITTDNNDKIKYTISLGISEINQDDASLEIALKKADILLYEAKNLGKNMVRF